MSEIAELLRSYSDDIRAKLRSDLKDKLGYYGNFDDDIWFQTKYKGYTKANKSRFKISFVPMPNKYKELTKYFVIRYSKSPGTNEKYVQYITKFCNFLVTYYDGIPFNEVNYKVIKDYKRYIIESNLGTSKLMAFNNVKTFFEGMSDFVEIPNIPLPDFYVTTKNYNTEDLDGHQTHVPSRVLYELDRVFLDYQDVIPVHSQLIYWILRLIPSRINEVLDMKISNALRPYSRDKYIITIPSTKTSGSTILSKEKMIYINHIANAEKHLLSLIQRQTDIAKKLQKSVEETNDPDGLKLLGISNKELFEKDLLFTVNAVNRKSINAMDFTLKKTIRNRYSDHSFNTFLKNLVLTADLITDNLNNKKYDFRNENGNVYDFSSHALRHEAITSRIDSGLFQLYDIMFISGLDCEDTIWDSYYNSTPKSAIQAKQLYNPPPCNKLKADTLNSGLTNIIKGNEVYKFSGNAKMSMNLLKLNQRIRRNVPIVDNDGKYYGNCRGDYYNCKKNNRNPCIGCEVAIGSITCDISQIMDTIKFWKSEVEFLKEKGAIYQVGIAQSQLESYSNRLNQLNAGGSYNAKK